MIAKQLFYAAAGAGDLALEKVRMVTSLDFKATKPKVPNLKELRASYPRSFSEARERTQKLGLDALKAASRTYAKLIKRGERSIASIRESAPTKEAVTKAKTARSQTKAAVTSARKAAQATVEATVDAAKQVAG